MTITRKKCPHCESAALCVRGFDEEDSRGSRAAVYCDDCEARGPVVDGNGADYPERAWAAWNRSASPVPFDPWSLPEVGPEYEVAFKSGRQGRGRFRMADGSETVTDVNELVFDDAERGRYYALLSDLRVWRRVES